jgi:hypothetical protein
MALCPDMGNSSPVISKDVFLCCQKVHSQLTVTQDLRPNENFIDFAVSPITGRSERTGTQTSFYTH